MYTDEDIIKYSKEVFNTSQLCSKLGIRPRGNNYYTIKNAVNRLNIDISHWKPNSKSNLKDITAYKTTKHLKKRLLNERGHQCQSCNNTQWMGQAIPLEAHHIDGNINNNLPENISLLCPNCHSLTNNWKNKKVPINKCLTCNKNTKNQKFCSRTCFGLNKQNKYYKVNWKDIDVINFVETKHNGNFCSAARELNISDNAVRKRYNKIKNMVSLA